MSSQDPKHLTICLGSSCFSRGNGRNLPRIQQFLRDEELEPSLQLLGARCEGHCQHGPILRLEDELIENVQPERLDDVLRRLL